MADDVGLKSIDLSAPCPLYCGYTMHMKQLPSVESRGQPQVRGVREGRGSPWGIGCVEGKAEGRILRLEIMERN